MEKIASAALHGGRHEVWSHRSEVLGCQMAFAVFIPPKKGPLKALYFLSGLTCTWENAATKAGAQKRAAELGLALIFPDTSPRGEAVADDAHYALGQGAGFYISATEKPWSDHYKMDRYITEELPQLVGQIIELADGKAGITGHSMGGHGALTLAMRYPDLYGSVSAFSPIVAPSKVPWGRDIFTAYLGTDEAQWRAFDACALLVDKGYQGEILVDVGTDDPFLAEQLTPHLLVQAATTAAVTLDLRLQEGYDHSYYFVTSFIDAHLDWHASRL